MAGASAKRDRVALGKRKASGAFPAMHFTALPVETGSGELGAGGVEMLQSLSAPAPGTVRASW
jgi:hypothetical protein